MIVWCELPNGGERRIYGVTLIQFGTHVARITQKGGRTEEIAKASIFEIDEDDDRVEIEVRNIKRGEPTIVVPEEFL